MSEAPKRPGRPPKAGAALTPAQRQRAYRERAYEASLRASENLPVATTMALLGNLSRQIKLIDADKDHAPVARDVAASVMLELCNRYKITLPLQ